MKLVVKKLAYDLAAAILTPTVLSTLRSSKVSILMYHGIISEPLKIADPCMIDVADFRAQMQHLKKHFDVVSLSEAHRKIRENSIDRRTAVITFDDGYQNNHDLALPVLEELQLPATIYLATKYVGTSSSIWTARLQHAFAETRKRSVTWRGQSYALATAELATESMQAIKAELKSSPNAELMKLVDQLCAELGVSDSQNLPIGSPYRMLDLASIKRLQDSRLIDLGAHTHCHFILSQIGNDMQEEEVRMSKSQVESLTSTPCTSFAYPNGQTTDYTSDTVSIVRKCGFETAVTTVNGRCDAQSERLEMPRLSVDGASSLSQFKLGLFNIPRRAGH